MDLTAADVLTLRMTSLLLRDIPGGAGSADAGDAVRPTDVAGVVTWFGAMQAQDMASVLWSLGVRLPDFTVADVNAALERHEALRTWPMRGTVHLVPARDARWMIELMGPRILAGAGARQARLGLTPELADRAVDMLGTALAGGGRMTRAECLHALADLGLPEGGQLGYHLLWYASQRGVTCIAPHIGKEQTFVLLDEWAPEQHLPERDEALATIATRYFRSHGPTTRQDFAGWTGLTAADAKRGIAAAGEALTTVRMDGTEMLVDPRLLDAYSSRATGPAGGRKDGELLVLPGFDEYLLGFKDRSLMFAAEHLQAIVPGNNGVFQPTVVHDGRVIATWKRTAAASRTVIKVQPLITIGAADRRRAERAFEGYGRFVGTPVEIRWP